MSALTRFFTRLLNFTTRRCGDERLREEMESHLAIQTEENIRAGMPLAEARAGFQTMLDGDIVGKVVFTT